MKWISIKERLPGMNEPVLVYDGDYYVAWIYAFGIETQSIWQYSSCCGCFCYDVTHWMYLPEVPEKEESHPRELANDLINELAQKKAP